MGERETLPYSFGAKTVSKLPAFAQQKQQIAPWIFVVIANEQIDQRYSHLYILN